MKKALIGLSVSLLLLSGCSAAANNAQSVITINIANSDDYILTYDTDNGLPRTLVDDFIDYVAKTDKVKIKVNYSVFSTPEEILSKVTAGTASYDLVNNSDYIVQKMMALDMLEPFATGKERETLYGETAAEWEDYYLEYASPTLVSLLDGITAKVKTSDGVEERKLGDYARGYMWGTLGITYNPAFSVYSDRGLSEDDVKVQMSDWNALWASQYHGTFQIKDSMRDTFAIGLMHVYDRFFKAARSWYIDGYDGAHNLYPKEQYQHDVKVLFNSLNYLDEFNALAKKVDSSSPTYSKEVILDEVQEALITLKNNSFGLEVDSGKTDITTGSKSGIDTAWSGDAITSMDLGDANSANPVSLYYSVPLTGGNIWSDNWVMLKSNVHNDPIKKQYCQKFIDYISNPEHVVANMDYIGYTSFIGGDEVLDYIRGSYDPRSYAMYVYDEEEEAFLVDENDECVYKDGSGEHDGYDYGEDDMRGSTYSEPVVNGSVSTWESYSKGEWQEIDLSYFFNDTLSGEEGYVNDVDTVFYSDELEEVTGKNLAGEEETVLVGRQFLAQYPVEDEEMKGTVLCSMPSLSIMEDYGNSASDVLSMWEQVKSSPLPTWAIAILVTEALLVSGAVLALIITKNASKKLRQKRREEKKASN